MKKQERLLNKLAVLADPRLSEVLTPLHAEADRQNARLVWRFLPQLPRLLLGRRLPWAKLAPRLDDLSLALDVDSGLLCYLLLRALRARRVIELGTSMGVSTLYLAAAVRDNGGGTVVATEILPEKAARARENLAKAGLLEFVDLRVGDARETLALESEPIDFLLNDAFPEVALPVLQRLTPIMRPEAIALCGNAVLFPADHREYLDWVRNPANGFLSLRLPIQLAGEISIRT